MKGSPVSTEWPALESRIDETALLAFDIYMARREKLYEIRAKEAKTEVSRLLQRAGFMVEIPARGARDQEGPDDNPNKGIL